jgi:hypothetical protein
MAGWDEISGALRAAPYPVQVLPPDPARAQHCLATLGITTASWLGGVVANSAGLLVDHGWLRVLGSGGDGMPDILAEVDPAAGSLIVGYDVLGGPFAWVPARPGASPTVHYFSPDDLGWQDLEQGYADWLYAVLVGSLTRFYEALRWPGWETEVAAVGPDEGIHTFPPPCSVEGRDLATVSRKAVPLPQLVAFHHDMASQLNGG